MEFLFEVAYNIPFVCIMITMACGIISNILDGKRAFQLNLIVSIICFILSALLLVSMYIRPQQLTFMMGHFPAPWGNEIRFGPVEVLLATCFTLVVILTILAEKQNILNKVYYEKVNILYLMINMLLSSTYALIYTNDLFTAYVFIEINTLVAVGLVAVKNTRKTIVAGIKYLIMSLLGSGLFLISISLLYVLTGHLLMVNVGEQIELIVHTGNYIFPLTIIIGLMSVGIAIKSGLFPFHNWMPLAYDRAFNFSNALSSGIIIKSYIILLIKIFYRCLGLDVLVELDILNILLVFGLLGMILGSLHALKENNLKKMLSYSSIAQIGYIYTAIGLGTPLSFAAAIYLIISHSFAKSMLMISAEALMDVSNNNKSIAKLKGAGWVHKKAGIAFTIGALTLVGTPLLSGFFGKYLLAISSINNGLTTYIVLGCLLISTLLNAMYFIRVLIVIYTKRTKDDEQYEPFTILRNNSISMIIFIIVNIGFSLLFKDIIEIIQQGLLVL